MIRLALAAILAAGLALPALAQPSSGSNNTPAGGANRMGEGGQVDRRPDAGAITPSQPAPATTDRSGAPAPTATPPAGSGGRPAPAPGATAPAR